MKNGNTSNLWFRLPNLEKENAADQSSWIAAIWSTRSFTKFVRVARGGCCPKILVLGKPSMATTGSGARIGPGHSFTTRCATVCAKPKTERLRPPQRSLTANRSRSPNKQENGATTRARRCPGASATWRSTAGIDSGDYDHSRRRAGPRGRQEPHQLPGNHVWAIADHLGRRRLLGSFGGVGQATAPLR